MNDPKIMFISSHARRGGSERYLQTLLSALPKSPESIVVCLEEGPFIDAIAQDHQTHVVATGSSIRGLFRSARRVRALAREWGPDLIHANGIKAAVVAAWATLPSGPPIVWVKHDFSWDGVVANLVAARSRIVVGVSDAVVASVPGRLRSKVRVVRPSVDVPIVDRAAARERLLHAVGAARDAPIALLVGRMHPVKGHEQMLQALGLPPLRDSDLRLVMVGGDDPSHSAYRQRVQDRVATLELGARVTVLDHREDVVELMAGADVLVIPSGRDERGMGLESFSLVALEAMGVGTPVVAFAQGGTGEVLGDCGVLVPEGDRQQLATAIAALLDDRDAWEEAALCGTRRAREHFTVDNMVHAMQTVYRSAVLPSP